MEREQFKVLVKAMKAVYAQPTFIPDQDAFNVWFALLGDLPYKQAELAVQKHMATEKFPPTIADIREKAEQITSVKETEMSELEAWAIVRKAIGRSNYYAEEEFEKLPEACKMAVGNPKFTRKLRRTERMNNPEAFKEDEVRSIKFVVPGLPFGKQRPKVTVRKFTGSDGKEKKFAKAYTPEKTVNYENLVKMAYQEKAKGKKFKDGDMLDVRIIAYYNIPPSTSKKRRTMMLEHKIRPTKKPDWDNIGKIVCDSLNNIAYHDDNQVVDAQVRKFFSENPRVEVTIRKVEG